MKSRFAQKILRVSLCLLFTLTLLSTVQAQSGRRSPKPLSPPTPLPKESETPAPAASKTEEPQQKLIVGLDDMGGSMMIPRYISEDVWSGFVQRFKELSRIVLTTDKNMRGKGASERAKKETESFVVLLQLDTNYVNTTRTGRVYPEDIVINYFLYAPVTGKTKAQGRVYVRASVGGIISSPLPTGRTGEAQLNYAGQETAERVLAALKKESPPPVR